MSIINELNEDFFDFIESNLKSDIHDLILHRTHHDFPFDFAITQIKSRGKTTKKIPFFLANRYFIFPTELSAEQSTNQTIAQYHSEIIGKGKNVLDMTAGLGIDSMTIALNDNNVTAVEIDPLKTEILKYNAKIFSIDNIKVINSDSIDYLNKFELTKYDVIFIDPARRDNCNKRTYALSDCQPDVNTILPLLTFKAETVMIKASPMLDISQIYKEIPKLKSLHIICLNGECKEVLIICCTKDNCKEEIKVIDLNNEGKIKNKWICNKSDFKKADNFIKNAEDISIGGFLYDPNAGIHKLNVSSKLCTDFPGLVKIAPNTELYYSKKLYRAFPGRIFEVIERPDKSKLKSIKGKRMEVAIRNYPISAENLRSKLNLKSGGKEDFIWAFKSGLKEKPLIITCKQILV